MRRAPWFLHPISMFIFSTLALGLSLFLYIHWYMAASANLQSLIKRFDLNPNQLMAPQTWVVIVVLSVLVGIILMGIFTIFVYQQKTLQLFTLQHTFINNFTHELKTPVTSLRLFLETLLKHDLSRRDQEKYINYMLADITRLSTTISCILNLAHLESKSYKANIERHDLLTVIEECITDNAIILTDCRVHISQRPPEPLIIAIDRTLMSMLVLNLITNAIKHNVSDVPEVDIGVHVSARHIHVDFKDNGVGLDARELKKIFRKFYQAPVRAGNMNTRGSGIGLHLAQSIARLHRGRITATSKGPGCGSIFTLTLPYGQRPLTGGHIG